MLENYRRTYPVIKEHRAIRKDKDKQKFYTAHETDLIINDGLIISKGAPPTVGTWTADSAGKRK